MNNELRNEFHTAYINGDRNGIKTVLQMCLPISIIKFFSGFPINKDSSYPQINNIDNSTIWVSSPNTFNDPFDCAFNMDIENVMYEEALKVCTPLFGKDGANNLLQRNYAKQLVAETSCQIKERLNMRITQISENVYVSCFSEHENLLSLRMWGHYASNHSGFCAEYDFATITRLFRKGFNPVRYSDKYTLNHDPQTLAECRAFRLQIGYTKAEEWQYEKEWRLMIDDEERTGQIGFEIQFPRPNKIYLGCKINDSFKKRLMKTCKENSIRIYQMNMKPESFELIYNEVTL